MGKVAKNSERESVLSEDQIADLRSRLAEPGPIASDVDVEEFFGRFRTRPQGRKSSKATAR